MHVNSLKHFLRNRGLKAILLMTVSVCIIIYMSAFVPDNSEVLSKKMNLTMRAIGHDLLSRAGDFTSIIPPVIEKSPGVFQIDFENEFAFQPDTLIAIVQRHVGRTSLKNYTVTVNDCNRPFIVYGIEITPQTNTTFACQGRTYPRACYTVEIAFSEFPNSVYTYIPPALVAMTLVSLIAFVLIRDRVVLRETKSSHQMEDIQQEKSAPNYIGKLCFDITNQQLTLGDVSIPLTDKECKVLMILHRNVGQLTSREELIEQVWTNEGVITGRSLDMFVSKLRKKLSGDPDVSITAIHGKGYRLDVGKF